MDDATQFWGGAVLIVVAGILLFAPLIAPVEYTLILLAVGVLGLALGAMLVGISGRGRAV